MSVDVLNITGRGIKQAAVTLFNEANGVNENIPLDSIFVGQGTGEGSVLLQISQSNAGLILNKILIQDVLPAVVDLTPFKIKTVHAGKELGPEDVAWLNNRYGSDMVAVEVDVLKAQNNYPIETLRNWVLLCRTLGFYQLDIGDVTLATVGNTMYVSVNPTHGVYSGYIEVRV